MTGRKLILYLRVRSASALKASSFPPPFWLFQQPSYSTQSPQPIHVYLSPIYTVYYLLCSILITLKRRKIHKSLVSPRPAELILSYLTDSTNSSHLPRQTSCPSPLPSFSRHLESSSARCRRIWFHCGVPKMERSMTKAMTLNKTATIATNKVVAPEDVNQMREAVYCPLETMDS